MSNVSRKQRRRNRNEIAAAKAVAQSRYTAETALHYFLITAKRDGRCSARGCRIRKGQEAVYRKAGPVLLCMFCAEADPLVDYRPSTAWEIRRVQRNRARARRHSRRRAA